MRVRALISVLLMAAWLQPAGSGACPVDPHDGGEHAQAHGAHDGAPHDRAGPRTPNGSVSSPGSDEPECCAQDPRSPTAQLSLPDLNPRPSVFEAARPQAFPALPAFERSATEAAFRRRQPPPLPYARTRRPLLI